MTGFGTEGAVRAKRGTWGVLACLPLLAACGTPDAPDAPTLDPVVIAPDAAHLVGTSDTIARIADLAPLDDGSVWVLNNTEPFLIHLSAEGEVLRTQGARGGGPGEFSWPSTLLRDPSTGEVWVFEAPLGRFMRVEEDGGEPEVITLPGDSTGPGRINSYEYLWMNNGGRGWMRGTEGGFLVARADPSVAWIFSLWSTDIVHLGRDGSVETVVRTADVVGDPSTRFPGATRFLPYPLWAACPDRSLAVYDPNRNAVVRLSAEGDSIGVHQLPPERRIPITQERIFTTIHPGILRNRLFADPPEPHVIRQMIERDYEPRADEFSEVFPEYAEFDCTDADTLWIQRFDTTAGQMGRGPLWLRISGSGAVGEVRFPERFRPMRFTDGRIWGIHRGEFDVDYVAWVEVGGL